MSLDLLTKLNPRTLQFAPSGGVSKYDLDDVIDAIAHLPPLVTTYIYAINECSSNDNPIRKDMMRLENYFNNIIYQQIVEDGFQTRKLTQQALARGIARAAIHAHFYAKGQCKTCNGIGIVFKDGTGKCCSDCWGKGISQINDVQKCRIAFPTVKFNRNWWGQFAKKYEQMIRDQLYECLMVADQALHKMKNTITK